jgi:hypothetical protein
MPNDFVARGVQQAKHVLAQAPAVDEYGFTYQSNTQGIHGSHKGTTPMTTAYDDRQTALEHRAGIDSLDALLHQRRTLVAEVAPLRAKYGPGGSWDARRKAHRSAIANEIASKGEKLSEAALERLAAADPRVEKLLDAAEKDMARLAILENDIATITERLKNRSAELFYLGAEARLGG